MRNLKLIIQYDGTRYNGWQKQKNSRRTIQEMIEKALYRIVREKVRLIGSGRTDTGVHALGQVANFMTASAMAPQELQPALNALLPPDIKVSAITEVALDFHSRFHAKQKTYRYTILNRSFSDVFLRNYVYLFLRARLDVRAMQRAAQKLVGSHDFSSFKAAGYSRSKSNIRIIKKLSVRTKSSFIIIEVTGSGFLHKMVRSIVGTLIEIGRGKLPVETLQKILKAKNRIAAGPTAPACGLTLVKVEY